MGIMSLVKEGPLRDAVVFATTRWDRMGDVEGPRRELDRPGDKAGVVRSFIETMYAASGERIDAQSLINRRSNAEVDEAFESVLGSLQELGQPGVGLARFLRSKHR